METRSKKISRMNQYLSAVFFMVIASTPFALSGQEGVIVDTTVVWKTPACAPNLFSNNPHSPLCYYKDSAYFVWVDASLRPWVTKVTGSVVETVPLDNGQDFTVMDDPHFTFSLGIDKKGYVHVTGDMHNYTNLSVVNYPDRYRNQQMLYWKSALPEDLSEGFQFAGGYNSPTVMPGIGYTYGRFFTDNNGELYYSSRIKAIYKRHQSGEMGLGVYKYDSETASWSALGNTAQDTRPGVYYDALLWENAGMAPAGWYQGLQTKISFDARNYLHFASSFNSNTSINGNNCLLYAFSSDQGVSWYKANGNAIAPLPLRAKDGLINQADVVGETQTAPFFDSMTQVIADKNGTPGILNGGSLYLWDGSNWNKSTNLFFQARTADLDDKGNLVFIGEGKLLYSESFSSKPFAYEFKGYDSYHCLDSYSLRATGVIYGIGINTSTNTQSILKTTLTPAPLPIGWHGQDINPASQNYDGTSGFRDGTFIVNSNGTSINSANTDSFYFVYTTLVGDGSITAQVTMQGVNVHSKTGVMMRESLDPASPDITMLISTLASGAGVDSRATEGATSVSSWIYNVTPSWVRLVRQGNVFSGYISNDGVQWTYVNKRTLALPQTLYIGLASASGHPFFQQNTTYSYVTVENN